MCIRDSHPAAEQQAGPAERVLDLVSADSVRLCSDRDTECAVGEADPRADNYGRLHQPVQRAASVHHAGRAGGAGGGAAGDAVQPAVCGPRPLQAGERYAWAVSYTHLDVYKRQVLQRRGRGDLLGAKDRKSVV